jgi:3D (Asp-Asp-Asp) domain-containing protein
MSRQVFLIAAAFLLVVTSFGQTEKLDKNGFGYAPPKLVASEKQTLWATFYYVHEAKYAESGKPLNDADDKPTGARLANCDWCDAAVEGTVRTTDKDGKAVTLNYAKVSSVQQCDCNALCPKYKNFVNKKVGYTLWAPAKGEFGDGVEGYRLVPFRTIAVDKALFPIGSLLFIPEAVGIEITLPDGSKSKHDGYFFAADVGGSIKGNHIDVFFGLRTPNPFGFVGSKSSKTFTVFHLKSSPVETELAKLHKD